MGSRRLWTSIGAQFAVVLCGALAILAWRARLPANGLVLALAAGGFAAWLAVRAAASGDERRPEPEAPAEHLDRERARRTLQAFLDQAPTQLVSWRPGGPTSAVNRAARRL